MIQLDESTQKYNKRMTQLDIKVTNTLLDVQTANERFAKKVEEVTDRWMSAMGKEAKVSSSLKAFNEQIAMISDSLYNSKLLNDRAITEMRTLINCEVKDIRSANQVYAIELERH